MSRVLVTGGNGFLGRRVGLALLASGHSVRVFDRIAAAPDRQDPGQIEEVVGDITDAAAVARAAEGCDALIHLAGLLTVACRADPIASAAVNVLGGLHAFEAARQSGIDRIAYVSSAGVFGPEDGEVPRPVTHYGAHKLALEGIARAYHADHAMGATGFRPYIVYGPGEGSGISAGPSSACRAAVEGRPFRIGFTGTVGFVHVDDVARAFAEAIAQPRDRAGLYTLQGETARIDTFIAELDRQQPGAVITADGPPMPIAPQLGGDPWPGWLSALPVTPLAEGIARTLAELRAGPSTP
ncbi:NAD-dependent epimerase/dehydratase family protein [Acidimangrovimonas sediminis]|uniref:NAD-dependent epimerase/dehydratase family protein n=1 Tax=Acidimangrovimonas sediminis TaxID=2056283 RepID=UPI000C80F44F|nr:NAD(P)-dependent oxidoreductase [Acidimangrovimonas sediminis]